MKNIEMMVEKERFEKNYDDFGLMFYNARFYSPSLGKFIQPDSIVPDPGRAIGFNRYSYVNNNPVNFTDPSGHIMEGEYGYDGCDCPDKSDPEPDLDDSGDWEYEPDGSEWDGYNPANPVLPTPYTMVDYAEEQYRYRLEFVDTAVLGLYDIGEAFQFLIDKRAFKGAYQLGRYTLLLGGAIEDGFAALIQYNDDGESNSLSTG